MRNSSGNEGAADSADIRALAEFRYQIRVFLNRGERAARAAGLEPQQYTLLLALRGLPEGEPATIRTLARRMQLRHHSVVELIDRLEKRALLRRERSQSDRREVIVRLTPQGEKILSRLARQRVAELRLAAPALVRALSAVIQPLSGESPRRGRAPKHGANPSKSVAISHAEP